MVVPPKKHNIIEILQIYDSQKALMPAHFGSGRQTDPAVFLVRRKSSFDGFGDGDRYHLAHSARGAIKRTRPACGRKLSISVTIGDMDVLFIKNGKLMGSVSRRRRPDVFRPKIDKVRGVSESHVGVPRR
jgi:hypothetical protein